MLVVGQFGSGIQRPFFGLPFVTMQRDQSGDKNCSFVGFNVSSKYYFVFLPLSL